MTHWPTNPSKRPHMSNAALGQDLTWLRHVFFYGGSYDPKKWSIHVLFMFFSIDSWFMIYDILQIVLKDMFLYVSGIPQPPFSPTFSSVTKKRKEKNPQETVLLRKVHLAESLMVTAPRRPWILINDKIHGSLNVPIFHITQPLGIWSINVYNGYYKVMSNIPKMGHSPTPVY